jgi:hypothetical protein
MAGEVGVAVRTKGHLRDPMGAGDLLLKQEGYVLPLNFLKVNVVRISQLLHFAWREVQKNAVCS